ncbi:MULTISPECIES: S8 family peptidase [unclassified Microbacterium]|uniref:S8 family peptidase n=1 Tax=unclassified Microbacterium TaxID=2609290 RepID=UPI00301A3804
MSCSPRRRALRLIAAAAVVAAIAAPTAASAAAVDRNWWYEKYGVAEVQAEGWNGAGVKIAVIDAQLNDQLPAFTDASLTVAPALCNNPATSTEVNDDSVHGSTVTAILVGNGEGYGAIRGMAPAADVTFYAVGGDATICRLHDDRSAWAVALDDAVAAGADIVTMSKVSSDASDEDIQSVARALASGVIFVAGTPNYEGQGALPAAMNGVVSVNAFDTNGDLLVSTELGVPNVQPEVTVVAPGVDVALSTWDREQYGAGSSFATPMVAGILAVAKQKYPDATANQLIQSLIHNTGTEDHPLERDTTGGYGYGPASLRHMLAVDPTQYPDENPLMDKSFGEPTAAQVAQAASPATMPTASASTAVADGDAEGPAASDAVPMGWIVGIGAAVLIGAIVVIVVVAARRRAQHTKGDSA